MSPSTIEHQANRDTSSRRADLPQIRNVESRLGLSLFLRRECNLSATVEAQTLYREVQRICQGVQAVQDVATEFKSGAASRRTEPTLP
jgi:DNA-binding transcriptional LysR family regulator